jgi:hypothetical protein
VSLAAALTFAAWLPASADATNTDYCDGVWNTSYFCYSPYAYSYAQDWMTYNEGINYSGYGNMIASLYAPQNLYTATATSSEYLAYLCFGNQDWDIAAINTPYSAGNTIAGHDDNYSRSGCPNQS